MPVGSSPPISNGLKYPIIIIKIAIKMKFTAVLLALVGSAAAFAPVATTKASSTVVYNTLEGMAGSTAPLKNFDPMGLANVGSESTLAWFQAAELKHGRAAMVATTGFLIQAAGIHFPGMLSHDVSFESLSSMNPVDQWEAVPLAGKAQIFATILIAEIKTEAKSPHYMMGGDLPQIVFPQVDFSNVSAETLKVKRSRELNNGRLAMIAIMSFISEHSIPGSVPVLTGIDAF